MSAPKMNRAAAEMMLQDWNETDAARAERDEARAEARRLRRALGVYANPKTWGADEWGVRAVNLREYGSSGEIARRALARPTPKKRKNTAKTHGTYWSHVNADRDTIQEMMRSDRQPKRKSARRK